MARQKEENTNAFFFSKKKAVWLDWVDVGLGTPKTGALAGLPSHIPPPTVINSNLLLFGFVAGRRWDFPSVRRSEVII
jgi:hypothetical protein